MTVSKSIPQFLVSLASVGLTLAGIGGLAYRLFRPGGWITQAVGDIWALEVHYLVMGVPIALGAAVMIRRIAASRTADGGANALSTLLMYLLMAYGLYTLAHVGGFNPFSRD